MFNRDALLVQWATYVAEAAYKGTITGKPCSITEVQVIDGPRAAALEILAGLDTGRLLKALKCNQGAAARAFIPWEFTGDPQVYMASRRLRVEAGWPNEIANCDIKLSSLGAYPKSKGRWVVGLNELGQTIIASVNLSRTPHWLISGASGAGKTVALRSALAQLALDPANRLVVIDGKHGAGFGECKLKGMVAPTAARPGDWENALIWAANEMESRYQHECTDRIIVLVDEVQEVIKDSPLAVEAIRQLATLGRDAGVHCLIATQHPVIKALGGPTVTRNLTGRLALHVTDSSASSVALGSNHPRADRLLGCGDCYVRTPDHMHRVQVAYAGREMLEVSAGKPVMESWPEYTAESLGGRRGPGQRANWPVSTEIANSLVSAFCLEGRPRLKQRLSDDGLTIGSERARRLLALGRETLTWLNNHGWRLGCEPGVITIGPGE